MFKPSSNKGLSLLNLALTLALLVGLAVIPSFAHAELPLYEQNGFQLNLSLDMAAGTFLTDNANFGAGSSAGEQNVNWSEGYFKPVLNASYSRDGLGDIYSGFSYVASATVGDGDLGEFTNDDSDGFESEQLFIGFKTDKLAAMGIDNLDISVGEQEFAIGDGFVPVEPVSSGPTRHF